MARQVVRRQRLLDKLEIIFLDAPDSLDGLFGRLVVFVGVQANHEVRAQPFSHSGATAGIGLTRAADLEAYTAHPVLLHIAGCLSGGLLRLAKTYRPVQRHSGAGFASQQTVHRQAGRFSRNIPQGHLDARFRLAPAAQHLVHALNQRRNHERVLADQCRPKIGVDVVSVAWAETVVIERAGYFAVAGDALVGFDYNQRKVRMSQHSLSRGEPL